MITRTAIFEGRPRAGFEERFYSGIAERLVPLWQQFPNAANVRWQRIVASDSEAPQIALIQQIDYPSLAALEAAIASPIRAQARAVTLEIMQMFEGRFYHFVGEAGHAPRGFPSAVDPGIRC